MNLWERFRGIVARVLGVPLTPPEPPPGSHAQLLTLRASPRWLQYRMTFLAASIATELLGLVAGDTVLQAGFDKKGGWLPTWFAILSGVAIVAVALGAAVRFALVRLDYDLRQYLLTERSLRIREGAWVVREITVTFANAQNVRMEQGPLQRLFDLWDLVIDTAGGGESPGRKGGRADGGHQARLCGLPDPHGVRAMILDRLRREKGAGLGDADDASHPTAAAWSPAHVAALREIRDELAGMVRPQV